MSRITIEFTDESMYRHGTYGFYISIDDLEYSGDVRLSPSESRGPDTVDWDIDVPDDWENLKKLIINELYNRLNQINNHG